MVCKKCEKRVVMPAFSSSRCKSCGKEIVSSNTPALRLCKRCSEEECYCEVCGKFMGIQISLFD